MTSDGPVETTSRRSVLEATGVVGSVALAGCLGGATTGQSRTTETTTGQDDELEGRITIAGSSTVYPLTLAVGNAFMDDHPDVTVSVTSTGTGGGFADYFCEGRTVVNDASREIAADEVAACDSAGVDPVEFTVATDAITVAVNPSADWVDCLSLGELAAIWGTDGVTKWNDLRPEWPNAPIELYGPTPASGTFDYFADAALSGIPPRTDHEMTEQDNVIAKHVSDSKYAIGYFGLAYYLQNRDAVRAVPIDDGDGCVSPSRENAKTNAYAALSRPLYIYVARESLSRPEVAAFTEYYLEQSTSVPADVGYVPVTEQTATDNLDELARHVSNA
ncbi:PstS family phosphate ABC transporter substrate-binding protein [Haloferax profundi]|uniref:Phosphate ABC transporter substrate-binding protein n=1 Tax=Haloferax profundi TaxID=1544718 RepID=A0A0W1SLQ7_9EURY|nr:PstS family phosphate ABC transporter substrate-binding protein [Haloferax profundi]KTG27177.1 phosphate ABC transporter substrate-binding protein [Haloferax profundi]